MTPRAPRQREPARCQGTQRRAPGQALRHRTCRHYGYSLLELVIAMLIAGLLLALLSQVLLQSYRLSTAATSSLTRAVTELAHARLRSDISRASATSETLVWSYDPLTLRLDDTLVTYSLEEGFLTRSERALDQPEDTSVVQQLVLASAFRWFSTGSPTVWIEWQHVDTSNAAARRSGPIVSQVEHGLFASRRPVERLFYASRGQRAMGW